LKNVGEAEKCNFLTNAANFTQNSNRQTAKIVSAQNFNSALISTISKFLAPNLKFFKQKV